MQSVVSDQTLTTISRVPPIELHFDCGAKDDPFILAVGQKVVTATVLHCFDCKQSFRVKCAECVLKEKLKALEDRIKDLEDQLHYMPGIGVGYKEARDDFLNHASQKDHK